MITGLTRDAIRDAFLADWAARMATLGLTLDTSAGSDPFIEADSLAAQLLRLQGNAESLGAEIDPATASDATVERRAAIVGVTRRPGTKGRFYLTVTGSAAGSIDLAGRSLSRDGRLYFPLYSSIGFTGGTTTLLVEAADAGTAYNLAAGDVLIWSTAPAGVDITATVASSTGSTLGTDEGTIAALRADDTQYRRSRPGSMNPAGWIAVALAQEDVGAAYVYPTLGASGAPAVYDDSRLDVPGAVCLLCAGPAQGAGTDETRVMTAEAIARITGYLRGTHDAAGNPVSNSAAPLYAGRRFPATIDPADITVIGPAITLVTVEFTVRPTRVNAVPWAGGLTTVAGSTTTVVQVDGDHSATEGTDAVFFVGVSSARGGWEKRRIVSAVYDSGTTQTALTLDSALAAAPAAAANYVYAAVGNWEAIRDAIFAFFDALGPADVPRLPTLAEITTYLASPGAWPTGVAPTALQQLVADLGGTAAEVMWDRGGARRRRFPPEGWMGPASVYRSKLAAVAMGAGGSVSVSVVQPGADSIAAAPFQWRALNELRIRAV